MRGVDNTYSTRSLDSVPFPRLAAPGLRSRRWVLRSVFDTRRDAAPCSLRASRRLRTCGPGVISEFTAHARGSTGGAVLVAQRCPKELQAPSLLAAQRLLHSRHLSFSRCLYNIAAQYMLLRGLDPLRWSSLSLVSGRGKPVCLYTSQNKLPFTISYPSLYVPDPLQATLQAPPTPTIKTPSSLPSISPSTT